MKMSAKVAAYLTGFVYIVGILAWGLFFTMLVTDGQKVAKDVVLMPYAVHSVRH